MDYTLHLIRSLIGYAMIATPVVLPLLVCGPTWKDRLIPAGLYAGLIGAAIIFVKLA